MVVKMASSFASCWDKKRKETVSKRKELSISRICFGWNVDE